MCIISIFKAGGHTENLSKKVECQIVNFVYLNFIIQSTMNSICASVQRTISELFGSDFSKILVTNQRGLDIFKNVFNTTEMNNMGIVGICMLDQLIPNENCKDLELIVFVGCSDIQNLSYLITEYENKISIYFYEYISQELLNSVKKMDVNNRINDIASIPLNFTVTSEYSAISDRIENLMPLMRSRPGQIKGDPHDVESFNRTLEKLNNNTTTLYSNENLQSMVLIKKRNYDPLVKELITWRYQSLLNRFDIEVKTDEIYDKIRYETYDVVKDILDKELKLLKEYSEKYAGTSVFDTVKISRKRSLLETHYKVFIDLTKKIEEANLFEKSEMEQNALMRNIDKKEFVTDNAILTELIYNTKKVMYDKTKSIYLQFVPEIRRLMNNFDNKDMTNVYIVIDGYITHDEICEVEQINRTSPVKFFLLGKSIDGRNYFTEVTKTSQSCNGLRVNRSAKQINMKRFMREESEMMQDIHNFKKLLGSPDLDGKNKEKAIILSAKITRNMMDEYNRIKACTPEDPLQKSMQQMELKKLRDFATEFKKIEVSYEKRTERMKELKDTYEDSEAQHEETVQLMQQSARDQEIIEREHLINEISDGIESINRMFVDIKLLVEEQGECLNRIEDKIMSAESFVKKGTVELEKANTYSKKGRKLMLGILGILGTTAAALGLGIGLKR